MASCIQSVLDVMVFEASLYLSPREHVQLLYDEAALSIEPGALHRESCAPVHEGLQRVHQQTGDVTPALHHHFLRYRGWTSSADL